MKKMLTIAIAAISVATLAQETPQTVPASTNETYVDMITGKPWTPDSKWTIAQLKARDERVLKKTGGFLYQEAEGPIAMLVDARDRATLTIDEVARLYKLGTKLDINTAKESRGEKCPLDMARAIMSETNALLVIMVFDKSDKLPALSVFPEERIGLVNADKLKGGDDPSAPEMRVSKEMWRAIGFIGGVGFSPQENDMMQPYYTLAEIDGNGHPYIQPMNMAKMQAMWKRFGVKRARKVPYRLAVREGWAHAPTNDYQRAVWEEERTNTTKKASAPAK